MEGVVPQQERDRRAKVLRVLSEKKLHHFYAEHLGDEATVLFEQERAGGMMRGFTENYIRVSTPYKANLVNTLQKVRLREIDKKGCVRLEMVESSSS